MKRNYVPLIRPEDHFKPFQGYKTCQACEKHTEDPADFELWEHVEGKNYADPYLVLCKDKKCWTLMAQAEDGFRRVSWFGGTPGRFLLLCNECQHRDKFDCTHPNRKELGGIGLLVNFQPLLGGGTRICFHDGNSLTGLDLAPAVACEGHPTRKPTVE